MPIKSNMQGKVVLLTGATAGIGEAAAFELARKGATLVLVGRSVQKAADTVARLREETGSQSVDYLIADLSTQPEVRRLADDFNARYDRLDVLLNNAGAFYARRQLSPDGIELTWALNHLSYFLLTYLLLDKIKASAPARIVSVSSDAHVAGKLNFDDLQGEKKFGGMRAYSQSKLANVMFTYELARRLEGSGVTANVMHPGFVASNFGKNNGAFYRAGMSLIHKLFAISPQAGARTLVYLASSPEVEGVSGKYFVKEKAIRSNPVSYDETAARRLWEISAQMTGLG